MSRKRWKNRHGCGWSYTEWSHADGDERDPGENGNPFGGNPQWTNAWRGNPWNHYSRWGYAAAEGPGFFGGRNFRILSGLRRDPWHGKVSGVCAGIGGYYGIRPKWIRLALIVSLFINLPLTLLAYGIATLLLKPLPEPNFASQGVGGQSEMNAGTSARMQREETKAEEELPPELRFAALKDKFRELEGRTGDIEGLVTSSEFRLRRDFKQMGEGEGGRA